MHSKGFFCTTWLLGLLLAGASGCSGAPPLPDRPGAEGTVVLPPSLEELRTADTEATLSADAGDTAAQEASKAPGPPWLRLVYSQDNRAELEPCGCPGSPTGGLARRQVFVRGLRRILPDVLVLEGPTCLSRAVLGIEVVRGEHRARARLLLDIIASTKPAAFFPGQADFEVIDPPELARLAAGHGLTLVSTNLAPEVARLGYRPYLLWEVGDRRVVILGLVGAASNEGARLRVPLIDAVQAAALAVEQARQEAGRIDLVVAFTDGDGRDQGRWREAGLDVDLLLVPPSRGGGADTQWEGGRYRVESEPLGRSFRRVDVVFAGPEGRSLGPAYGEEWPLRQVAAMEELALLRSAQLAHAAPEDAADLRKALEEAQDTRRKALAVLHGRSLPHHLVAESLVTLRPELPEDPEVTERLRAYRESHLRDIQAQVASSPPAPSSERYLGHDACIQCHPDVAAQWARSPHASAWLHLAERGETGNPECLSCHTTGFGRPGGFVDPEQDKSLLNVQCEACHGPMALHVEQAARLGFRPESGLAPRKSTCLRCHDEANSPAFDCNAYLPRIAHPRSARAGMDGLRERVCGGG